MSDLLTAARQALPGAEWREDGPRRVRAKVYGFAMQLCTVGDKFCAWFDERPDKHRATATEAAAWLRAQVESRRNALDAALGDSQWARVAELEKAVAQWVGMHGIAAARADAAEAKLKALVGLVERWPELDCASWCSDLRCNCGAEDQNLARAAARLALGLEG